MAVLEEESSSSSKPGVVNHGNNKSQSSSNSNSAACYLAKTVLTSSVVLQVVRGHFRSSSSSDVIFGKETSIEMVIIDNDGIVQSISEQPVFGIIKDLAVLPWNKRFQAQSPKLLGKDILVVLSDSGKLSFLSFCNEMHRFFPLTHFQLSSPGNSRYQLGRMLAVDSSGCYVAASAYEDRLAIFSISMSASGDIIDKRIFCPPENEGSLTTASGFTNISGTIWSMCFISKDCHQLSEEHNPVLAILLNRRGSFYRNELLLLEWNIVKQAVHVIYQFAEAGPLAHHIVEVPNSHGCAFLFRAGDALLMDFRDVRNPCCVYKTSLNFTPPLAEELSFVEDTIGIPDIMDEEGIYSVAASALLELSDMNKNDDPMNIDDYSTKPGSNYVCSWSWEPGNLTNPRMIFSADTGELYMIQVFLESDDLRVNLSDCLYKGPPSKALLWVEGGFLAAVVDMADGMVLKLEDGLLQYRGPIQSVAPILDISVVDHPDENHDQIFACSGMAPEGTLRVIRNGISVEKLLKTSPIYHCVTGTWTVKMKVSDPYHSFLVLSFVEETRVLSVGLSFTDVTDSVGFQPDVCTLACGLVADGVMIQIHQCGIRLCVPVRAVHPEGVPLSSPVCTSWFPDNMTLSLGAVGCNLIVVATSSPYLLFVLGVRSLSAYHYEIYQMQCIRLQNELSCISIPQKCPKHSLMNYADNKPVAVPTEINIDNIFVIGTHKPSVEVISFVPDKGLKVLATGIISLTNTVGTAISGCIPQDVRLVLVDRLYVLSGLRNGMLLRFEWPVESAVSSTKLPSHQNFVDSCLVNSHASLKPMSPNYGIPLIFTSNSSGMAKGDFPVSLELIAVRRIGITPVFLVPLSDSLDADMIALSDRPWLLQTARHSLSYTSISFQPSTHLTPVSSIECPRGVLFVAENSLHLVEMVPSKRLNVQKFPLGGTPRKVLYHSESRLLIVMRTELDNECSSDVCCIDPLSGSVLSSFKFEPGEIGKCMELVKVGDECVLVIGTSQSAGPAIMPSGEAESTKGRLLVLCLEHMRNSESSAIMLYSKAGSSSQWSSPFCDVGGYAAEQLSSSSVCSSPDDNSSDGIKLEETESWHLRLAYSTIWPGMVLALCPYLGRYFLASAGNSFYVCGFSNDNSHRVRRLAVGRTRFMIMTLTAYFTRIAVGDCRDGVLFYSYHEDARKLEQVYCDPVQRLVADCVLMDVNTAVVSDRKGSIAVLSCANYLEDNASPERNLTLSCSYYMGDIAMRIKKVIKIL
ncbi:uncharacterized protein LOC111399497 isoform X1 [Olea europaea var. sylvestris]|uniref:uncharacterized protein LOC111399497 isoform X1 n=2 Tax=Olea europaea var. sylvestris TaxID=158386 RepID=UPI000C1D28EC|nr:uncharacterized protein LOC111399497 isoform X1 [Olea europaea var. sylvestris]